MPEHILRYGEPARVWEQALPLGNGRIGAMVFGRAREEIIRLNEETLWEGYAHDWLRSDTLAHLEEIRTLIFAHDFTRAQEVAERYLVCRGRGSEECAPGEPFGTFRTAGDLVLVTHGENKTLLRTLDLVSGVAQTDTSRYEARTFASMTTHALIVRVFAKGEPLTLDVRFDPAGGGTRDKWESLRFEDGREVFPQEETKDVSRPFAGVCVEGDTVFFAQTLAGEGAMRRAACVRVSADGDLSKLADGLRVASARQITIYVGLSTSYRGRDAASDARAMADSAFSLGADAAEEAHRRTFASFITRSSFSLEHGREKENMDTHERLCRFRAGEEDPGLYELYFLFGKYLLVSSSAPGCLLPANLQGIWSKADPAPWSADYHININLQMNYWPALVTGLADCETVLFDYIDFLSEHGKKTARVTYGCRGWVAHHATTPWGYTAPGRTTLWGVFTLGGAWLCLHLFDYYRVTGDRATLCRHWQAVKDCARFFLDFLVRDPETGYLLLCPSHSPENGFADPATGARVTLSAGTTIDTGILADFFDGVLALAHDAGEADDAFLREVKEKAGQLPPIRVGKNGTIMEWLHDYEETEPGHRHLSHLFALYPSHRIKRDTPELFEAARRTIERRLAHGGGHTGWSRAWIINFFARLLDGEQALYHLDELLKNATMPNLLDVHPPFQIDGNFGGCAGIAEMLVQEENGEIRLLPALPPAWKTGSFTGFRTAGNQIVSCAWREGKIISSSVEDMK